MPEWGGDEFLVILEQQTDLVYAADIAKRLITALTRSFDYDGNALQVGCSVGISFAPDHASDPDGLKRAADAAMYEVKKAGKNSFVFATRHQANAPLSC